MSIFSLMNRYVLVFFASDTHGADSGYDVAGTKTVVITT